MVEKPKIPHCLPMVWNNRIIEIDLVCKDCPYNDVDSNPIDCTIPELLKDHEELQVILRKKKEGNYESDSK